MGMFNKSVHCLMVLIVLACPALGGRCCDAAEATTVSVGQVCDACPCHEAPLYNGSPSTPTHHDCPQSSHNCICEGALPAGPTVTDVLDIQPIAVCFVCPHFVVSTHLLRRATLRLDNGPPPLGMGERLATLCTLQI